MAGWLFYDFRGSDILAPRILNTTRLGGSRRWFYYVPASGEPVKVVHAIEPGQLDSLPGKKLIYREWQLLGSQVAAAVSMGNAGAKTSKEVMVCDAVFNRTTPSRTFGVDAGTIEMVRKLGINVVSSADLVQQFEAVWTPEQLAMHNRGGGDDAEGDHRNFAEIKRRVNSEIPTTENDVQHL